ncbi:hypothetical protein [Leucobacter chromiireducens]|uniref:hypothetical protein n=1 Tax=Leucobacter chromiireducens TaxID=283877 RepID=UPI003F7E2AEC
MTRKSPPSSPFDGWMPLTEYAWEVGIPLGTARVRAWRALRGTYEDAGYEFARTAPQEKRSTVLAKRKQPHPPQ